MSGCTKALSVPCFLILTNELKILSISLYKLASSVKKHGVSLKGWFDYLFYLYSSPLLRDHLKNIKKWSLKRGGLTLEVHSIDQVVT